MFFQTWFQTSFYPYSGIKLSKLTHLPWADPSICADLHKLTCTSWPECFPIIPRYVLQFYLTLPVLFSLVLAAGWPKWPADLPKLTCTQAANQSEAKKFPGVQPITMLILILYGCYLLFFLFFVYSVWEKEKKINFDFKLWPWLKASLNVSSLRITFDFPFASVDGKLVI